MSAMPRKQTVVASGARTTTFVGGDEANQGWHGVIYILDITAVSGTGTETLTLEIDVKDPASGKYLPVTSFPAYAASGGVVTKVYYLLPSASETVNLANSEAQSLVLPTIWRVQVIHSGTGSWTYSLGEHLIG